MRAGLSLVLLVGAASGRVGAGPAEPAPPRANSYVAIA